MAIKRAKKKKATKAASRAKKTAKKPAAKPKKKAAPKAASKAASKIKAGGWVGDVAHLLDMMMANDLSEIQIEDGPRKIVLRRGPSGEAVVAQNGQAVSAAPTPAAPAPAVAPAETLAEVSDGLVDILSPMVGTFYGAPSPDSDAFVTVGGGIGEETVICIVEAMKVMNEIKAECSGTIVEVCVRNAQPVEYGQVLFKVRPS